jgi:hypothetical protein
MPMRGKVYVSEDSFALRFWLSKISDRFCSELPHEWGFAERKNRKVSPWVLRASRIGFFEWFLRCMFEGFKVIDQYSIVDVVVIFSLVASAHSVSTSSMRA